MSSKRSHNRFVPLAAVAGVLVVIAAIAQAQNPSGKIRRQGTVRGLTENLAAPLLDAPVILNEYNAVGPAKWLDCDGELCPTCGGPPCKEDSHFHRVVGNGGNWFEIVVTLDLVDMRGWKLEWQEGTKAGTLTLTNDLLWSDLRAGTIITFAESDTAAGGLNTDTSFNPAIGDWWININTLSGGVPQTTYVTTTTNVSGDGPGNFSVGNDGWQLRIKDAADVVLFDWAGEGACGFSGVSSNEVGKLEADPGPGITCASNYQDGTSSTFGRPNTWSGGDIVQDFSALRHPGTTVALIAVPSFDVNSLFEDHSTFPNLDEVLTLPSSLTSFSVGQIFFVELWAQTMHQYGLATVSIDLEFDPVALEVVGGSGFPSSGVFHTTLFNVVTHGTPDNLAGSIDDLSGGYLPSIPCVEDSTGIDPVWSRIAVIKMRADVAGSHYIVAEPTGSTAYVIAHCSLFGEIDPKLIDYRSINEPQGGLVLSVPNPPQTVMQGEQVTVDLVATNLTAAVNEVQALINYNPVNLDLVGIAPAGSWTEVSEDDINGDVAYAATITGGSVGPGAGPFPVATLTFLALDDGTPVISFLPDEPDSYPDLITRLTEAAHGQPVLPTKTDTVDGHIIVLPCDDDNICTADEFNDLTRECVYTPVPNGSSCTDGAFCNGAETCQGGACTDGADPCVDLAHCDEATDTCWSCISDGECDDGNVCTDDACVSHECVHTNNTGPCNDGNACTTGDACSGGTCVGGTPSGCDDHNVCTDDSCDPDTGCVNTPDDSNSCSDGEFCNGQESCLGGICRDGPDPCLDPAHCDEVNDVCLECQSDADCDDGLWCNGAESCGPTTRQCEAGTPPDCSDGDECTLDTCDEDLDACAYADVTRIDVAVQIEALNHAVTRQVTLVITDCEGGAETRVEPVSFDATGHGKVTLTRVSSGADWLQATEGHTLSRLLPLDFAGGCFATANFTGAERLVAGDFSNPDWVPQDNLVDIVDFAILSVYWNKLVDPNQGSLADATGDGVQNVPDFTAIQVNFAEAGDAQHSCPGMGIRAWQSATLPVTNVAVSRLRVPGVEGADWNADGVINTRDIREFSRVNHLSLTQEFLGKLDRIEAAEAVNVLQEEVSGPVRR